LVLTIWRTLDFTCFTLMDAIVAFRLRVNLRLILTETHLLPLHGRAVKFCLFLLVIPAQVAHPEKRDQNLLRIRTGFFLLNRFLLTIRRSRAEHGMTALINSIRT
jgi:hypothetical protein